MANKNLALQLLITAKDEASAIFSNVFKSLNDSTNVIATKVREAFTGVFGGAVDSAAAFEEQLGKVQAKGDESYADTAKLKQGLQDLAGQFGITGTQAAQGMEVLAAAGLNATDAMKALPAVLNLAKIENLSLDDAATKLSDTLSIMGLKFSDAGLMADVLAKGANISTASAAGLAEALSVAGGQAKMAGLDLQATVAALDLLHSAGIKGSAAGTSLAAILTQLQNPASAASVQLNKLGINSRDLGDVLDGLKNAGVKSSAAILAFGETAGPGLQAMVSKGSAALDEYDAQLRNSGGAAQEAANKLDQNLNSALGSLAAAWTNLKSALADPILKPIADGAREVATALNTALTNGALKPAQEAVKAFAENGIASIKDFVKNFDFKVAMDALGGFLTSAKESFDGIKTAGTTAAADRLKLQINQTSALTELERRLAEARALGNKELAAIYQQQIAKTNELYALKNRNLEADIAGDDRNTKIVNRAVENANRLKDAYRQVNEISLSGLNGQIAQISDSVNALRGVL